MNIMQKEKVEIKNEKVQANDLRIASNPINLVKIIVQTITGYIYIKKYYFHIFY